MAKEKPTKQEASEPKPEAKKKIPLMKYLIIAGILIAQTAAAYYIQKTILRPASSTVAESVETDESASEHSEDADSENGHGGKGASGGSSVALLDEIIVNPAGTGGRRFLSTVVGLALKDPKMDVEVQANMPVIRDAAISLLSSKTLDQLASVSYRDTIRHELVATVNEMIKAKPVKAVVFSTYVLQ